MDLKGIISISGKPGLYKVVAQGRNNIIVKSLNDERKFPVFATDKISALEDISIYTYEEDLPLVEVYKKLGDLEGYKKSINHKENGNVLREKVVQFLPNYDEERVFDTDLKKLFQWYNLLIDKKIIVKPKAEKKSPAKKKVASEEEE